MNTQCKHHWKIRAGKTKDHNTYESIGPPTQGRYFLVCIHPNKYDNERTIRERIRKSVFSNKKEWKWLILCRLTNTSICIRRKRRNVLFASMFQLKNKWIWSYFYLFLLIFSPVLVSFGVGSKNLESWKMWKKAKQQTALTSFVSYFKVALCFTSLINNYKTSHNY